MRRGPPTKEIYKLFRVLHLNPKNQYLGGKCKNSLEYENDYSKEKLLSRESMVVGKSRNLREIPKGYLAVYVGDEMQRYVIPAIYLSFPDFSVLMESVAEEFGYEQEGGLRIPCEEEEFQEILLRCFEKHRTMKKKKSAKRK